MPELRLIFFVLILLLYLVSAVCYYRHFLFHDTPYCAVRAGRTAWLLHTLLFVFDLWQTGIPPFFSLPGAIFFLTWLMTFNVILVELLTELYVIGTFLYPVVFVLLLYSARSVFAPDALVGVSESYWLTSHILLTLLGYAVFTLASITALLYLLQEHQLKSKIFHVLYRRLPPLRLMDQWSYRLVISGFVLLSLGILIGTVNAENIWPGVWPFDAKVLWSWVIWLIYAFYIWSRKGRGWQGRLPAYLALAGFAAILLNLFVINQLTQKHLF